MSAAIEMHLACSSERICAGGSVLIRGTMRVTSAISLSLTIFALVLLAACTTAMHRKAVERAAIQKEAAQEVGRICALPPAEREAELGKIEAESGIVIQCGGVE